MPHDASKRKPNRRAGLALLGLLVAAAPGLTPPGAAAQTILNTERFQLGEVRGPHLTADLSLTGRSGNSEIFVAEASGIAGLYSQAYWTRIIFGGSYLADGDRSLLDSRFAQIRHSWRPEARWHVVHFVQAQQNESLRLRSRWLAGTLLAGEVVHAGSTSLSLGSGAMLEWERLDPAAIAPDEPAARDRVRMTNVVVLRHRTEGGLRILNILYVQPRFDDLADLRILNDLGLGVPVGDHVRLTMSAEWRRDTRPPAGLERDDLTLKMGAALDFR